MSMQEIEEKWEVMIGKNKFTLNGEEFRRLDEAMKFGKRWVRFDDKIFSVPHIEYIYRIQRGFKESNMLEAGEDEYNQTPEERERALKKMQEVREKLKRKLSI